MAVERVGMAIAIWVACAVLLVVVIILAIYLFCCLRRRRRRTCDVDEEEEVHSSRHEAYLETNGSAVAMRVYSDEEEDGSSRLYGHYRRGGVQDVLSTPTPGAYQAPALLVQLTSYLSSTKRGRVDILVNVLRQDINVPDPRYTHSFFSILGNVYDQPGYLHDDFLLYTAPLYFTAPGRYVVQAYTVNTQAKTVGPVHQFVFVLTTDGTGALPATSQSGAVGLSAGGRQIDVNVDQQAAALVPYGGNAVAAQPSASTTAAGAPPSAALVDASQQPCGPYDDAVGSRAVPTSMMSRASWSGAPLPPRIEPSKGTVTTTTRIVISPHPHSAGGDYIRYSVDGSYPSLTYTGPFTLSLPHASVLPERRLEVRVKAISLAPAASSLASPPYSAITASQLPGAGRDSALSCPTNSSALVVPASTVASPVVEATLTVRPSGYSYYDPALPTPSVRVRAQGAKLYFDETNNPMRTCTCYQIVSLDDARHHTIRFNKRRSHVYRGQPIPLLETIAMVYAWTVDESALLASDEDDALNDGRLNGRAENAEPFTTFSPTAPQGREGGAHPGAPNQAPPRIRSVATIYNCSRASTEHGQASRKRVPPGASLLPPPVLCISCDEVQVEFDEPPAHSLIAYTLNNKEPALLDVSPPACAVPITGSSATNQRTPAPPARDRSGSSARQGLSSAEVVEADADGRGTFIYETGKPIQVTQLESEGVFITARLFAPLYESAGGDVVGDSGAQGGTASAGGAHLGYRYGDAFHRGFFFNANQ